MKDFEGLKRTLKLDRKHRILFGSIPEYSNDLHTSVVLCECSKGT